MKYLNQGKNKAFPYAVVRKKATQQWDYLRKLSNKEKRLYKNKSRFYSLEYGRSLSKRVLWQIAALKPFSGIGEKNLFSENPKKQTFFQKTSRLKTPAAATSEKKPVFLNQSSLSKPWPVFRSILFGKMWMLYNPALVPGVVWPTKNKKSRVAKIRAFKTVEHLVGKSNVNFLTQNLQKLWNLSSTTPSLWSLASGLGSLKTHLLLKSGFACTIPGAFSLISGGKLLLNGSPEKKGLGFYYPGDFISIKNSHSLTLGNIFSYGTKKTRFSLTSVNSVLPFIWLSSFYKYGKVLDFYGQQKQTLKKRRMFSKNFTKKKFNKKV